MAEKKVMLTQEGYDELVARLEHLKSVRRIEVADRLKAAIALGDLSENSEYTDAKNEQAFLEGEIVDLENQIRNAEIIQQSKTDGIKISVRSSEAYVEDDEPIYQYTYAIVRSTKRGLYIMVYENDQTKPKYIIDKDMIDRIKKDMIDRIKKDEEEKKKKSEDYKKNLEETSKRKFILAKEDTAENNERPEVMHWRIGNELMQKKVNDVVKLAKGFNNAIFYEVTDIVEVVTLGSKVRIRFPENINNPYKDTDENYDKVTDTYTYTIVGTTETNPDEGKISDESPVGDALLGQPAGSVVPVYSPRGILSYEIVDIIQN